MATTRITDTIHIKAPVEELFEFYSSVENLALLVPPEFNLRLIKGSGVVEEGSRFLFAVRPRLVPFEVHWTLRVVEYRRHEGFAEELEKGPFSYWNHRHIFESTGNGSSKVTDTITYGPPTGFAAHILSPSFIKTTLQDSFRHREKTVRQYLENATR